MAEADKPLLDSLCGPCDWEVSAICRVKIMIRFLAGDALLDFGFELSERETTRHIVEKRMERCSASVNAQG